MFRMLGNKVELIRYTVSYMQDEIKMQENCMSGEHKNEVEQMLVEGGIEFITTAIDQSQNEWFNGLEFNSYNEALTIFNQGENAYKQEININQSVSNEQLRADTDYIAIMSGVEL